MAATDDASLLRKMIDSARESVLVVDADSMALIDCNHFACRTLGWVRNEMIGMELSKIECSLLDVFFWDEISADPAFDGERTAQTEWMRCDGTPFHVEKRVFGFVRSQRRYWIIHAIDLTRQKMLEQQQLRLVSQLQSSMESTAEGILSVDLSGQIVNMNRRFGLMWNMPDSILLERSAKSLLAYVLTCLDNGAVLQASLERADEDQQLETEDLLALRDGRYFICVSRPEFLRDRLIGRVYSVRDITQMKKIETDLLQARDLAEQASQEKSRMLEALQVSESRLRRLVNSNLIGIMQGDMSGNIVEANDVLLRLLGVDRRKVVKHALNWLKLTSESSHSSFRNALKHLKRSGQSQPFEVELVGGAAAHTPAMVGLARLEGSDTEWVGFVLDLTRQRESDRAKSDFIAMVSHELRTPLTSIHGSLGLLDSGVCGDLPDPAKNLIQVALRNSQRLGVLVNDLLDMEKLASGKMSLNLENIDLLALIRLSIEANLPYAQPLKVHYRLTDHPTQARAVGDSNRLLQVMANLLSNAAKFSVEGSEVAIRIMPLPGFYRIEVEDRGAGIPVEFRDRIFKKFAQADGGDTRRQGGTGLGLNITKSLVEKMGGAIGFDSEIGQGTVFWFTVEAFDSQERTGTTDVESWR
jgi:PAS domain S-box-containing protein